MKQSRLTTIIRLAALLLAAAALAACAEFDPGRFLPPEGATTPAATMNALPDDAGPTPTSSLPSLPTLPVPAAMCTPPACGDSGYACLSGDCPNGCGMVCLEAPPPTAAAPAAPTGPLSAAPTDWEGLEAWLVGLWQGNVNPAAVRAALQQSGMQKSMTDWAAADFNGDLLDEWVLVLYDQSLPGLPFGSAGDLWIVNGDGVAWRYYTAPSNDIYEFLAPAIVSVIDMNDDGLVELITNTPVCGAHTCYDNYRVIGLKNGQLADLADTLPPPDELIPNGVISMSYADTRVYDIDADGLPELVIHGGTIGSAGAGVVRPRTEVWGWDGVAVSLTEVILDPTTYRHHILYEANDLMAQGELDAALALYETTINDAALRDDGYGHPPAQVRADIHAFAAFRLMLIDLLQRNSERAEGRLAWLQANYPASAAAAAGTTLVDEWINSGGLPALCDQIEAALAATPSPTGTLADMGYGNPSLTAADFCP